ncbi:MAG: hydrogenase maturation protease [Acidobacteria bacterium]|nr:hydrogenase maturation protease [Acidobacteriota bacterium]MCA1632482.1 hydrogenase maturation protease [Acidobacteriota bacterium]MCA1640835.1 hydrogenase maturation protease [Acidobacteriota bacterium]
MRILIAGVGNILRGDDGFGVEVAQTLLRADIFTEGVTIMESGIAGIPLVQELMDGYDALIIIDAVERGGAPGTLYVIEPEVPAQAAIDAHALHSSLADAHYTEPSKVLALARALGVLPPRLFVVGCQPEGYDELGAELSEPVRGAVGIAVSRIESLIESLNGGGRA